MRSLPLLGSLGLLLLAAAAAPARAGDGNELTIGSWNRALRSPSANAVTDDNLAGGALTYARDLRIRPVPGLAVWATGSFTWAGAGGTMFRTLATDVGVLGLSAGGRARYRLHDRVAASARLDLGAARTRLRLEDAMGRAAADARWAGIATVAVGLDLLAIAGPRFALGLRAEVGYVAARAPALTASPDSGDDDDVIRLPMSETSLGHLDLGGRFFGVSLVSQF
jgi:hypothetical protein